MSFTLQRVARGNRGVTSAAAPPSSPELLSLRHMPRPKGIMWGVNGHPVRAGGYPWATMYRQLNHLYHMGFQSYRVDLYDTSSGTVDNLRLAIRTAQRFGIQILPVLIPAYTSTDTEAFCYTAGFNLGQGIATIFHNDIHVWECSNERDNYCLTGGGSLSGEVFAHYDVAKYEQTRGEVNGLQDGIKSVDPTAQCMVSTAGWVHFGWTDQLWADGMRWDITGWHWYSEMGSLENAGGFNVALELKKRYGKPIWMTEFNRRDGSESGEQLQADVLMEIMNHWDAISAKYNIQAAHVYELLDEQQGFEDFYGFMAVPSLTPKLNYNTVKAFISSRQNHARNKQGHAYPWL